MNISLDLIERLLEVPADARRTTVLNQNPQLRERATILEIADQVNRVAREDLGRAERIAQIVAWLSDLSADDFCRARGLRCLGNIQVLHSNYQQAILYFEDSLQLFERLGNDAEVSAAVIRQNSGRL